MRLCYHPRTSISCRSVSGGLLTFQECSDNRMKIPVFVSCPSKLNAAQDRSRDRIVRELTRLQLEPRALGRSDYPADCPLREVYFIAKHCSGGLILGFRQFSATAGLWKPG